MNRIGNKYRIFLAAWALSALFLCIGSLVHFHQWKIYGKPLLSEVVVSKREQDVIVKVQPADSHCITAAGAILSEVQALPVCSAVRTAITSPGFFSTNVICLANSGLRAPPLA